MLLPEVLELAALFRETRRVCHGKSEILSDAKRRHVTLPLVAFRSLLLISQLSYPHLFCPPAFPDLDVAETKCPSLRKIDLPALSSC
jgi:hypothetical protein